MECANPRAMDLRPRTHIEFSFPGPVRALCARTARMASHTVSSKMLRRIGDEDLYCNVIRRSDHRAPPDLFERNARMRTTEMRDLNVLSLTAQVTATMEVQGE